MSKMAKKNHIKLILETYIKMHYNLNTFYFRKKEWINLKSTNSPY